jgi:hypothetical protein
LITLAGDKQSSLFCRRVSDEGKKVLIKLTPGVNVINFFPFITDAEAKEGRAFVPGKSLSSLV